MSQQTAGWDVIPFESSKTVKPSLFWKLGNKLGNIFVSAKHKAKSKYVEVTKGINQRIAEEDEMRALELQMCLDEQAPNMNRKFPALSVRCFSGLCWLPLLPLYVVWLPFLVLSSL